MERLRLACGHCRISIGAPRGEECGSPWVFFVGGEAVGYLL